ncbi:MAG: PDZ domain-containing protein [Saprospiraceae bacterium]
MRYIFSLTGCFLFVNLLIGQGTRLLRQPSISQDHIVFVYADDLWLVGRDGGEARRVTSAEGAETLPHFSPDGTMIAFTGQYDGNTDVFVVPTTGGEPRRLTWHPDGDFVQGWTPDGQSVLFRSSREGRPTQTAKLYTVSLQGGLPAALPIPRAAYGELSADGAYIAYTPITGWDAEWRNYRGGQAMPIWMVNMKDFTLKRIPQPDKERHLDPVWYKGKVYFLSERDYASNIWSFDPTNDELKQLTFHRDFDVKSLDAGPDAIIYEQGSYLHELNPATGKSRQVVIHVRGDFNWARPRWEDVRNNQLANASLSPTGQRALFEYRGDVFTAPKEKGDWRNITQSSGVADRAPVWSPDGQQIAWFSDQSGEYTLMIGDQVGLEKPRSISLPNPTFYFKPAWSPDGKHIAYTDTDYNLWYVNVESGVVKKADTDRFAHPNRSMNPVWSPDGKWIAYARLLDNQHKAIKVHQIETGQTYQLTDGMADAISPIWDKSGKYLYFLASTNFGLNTGWLDMSSYDPASTYRPYMILLRKDEASPFLPESDEEPKSEAKSDKKEKKDSTVIIDIPGLARRIIAIDVPDRNYNGLVAGPEGMFFYGEGIDNQPGFTLNRYDIKKKEAKVFLTGINEAEISHDRKQLLYNSGQTWGIVSASGAPPKVGDGKLALGLKMKIDPMAEWAQIFKEGWRYQRDFLYVNNVHGAPWKEVYEWYRPWVDHVRHRSDLNYIVDIIGGEVAIGHSYTSGGDFPNLDNVAIGLLGADLEAVNGFYRIKKIYSGENWNPGLEGPLAIPGLGVKTGDYILSIDGEELRHPLNPFKLLEGKADRQVKLLVNSKPSIEGANLVTVKAISSERQLRYQDWVEGNRRKVDSLSNGQLAYVYIPNTSGNGFASFNRYYFAQQDKKGAVIDERNNGGGSAADYMVDVMARQLHGYFNSKANDHRPFTTPMAALWGPKVMIINERAGSGGDLLPYLFHKMEIGPLVGTRTWGGLVGTWDTPRFIDGGRMVAPRGGFYDVNGEWAVEGVGISPDVEVIQEPAKVIQGHDPQLERAVQEALKLLETERVELKPEPAAPIRWKRPGKG